MTAPDACAGCGFVYDDIAAGDIAPMLGGLAARWRTFLTGMDAAAARRRPSPAVWAPLEYACHVRDVLLTQRDRVIVALAEDTPTFAPIYRDQRVAWARYDQEDVNAVADHIAMAAHLLATVLSSLTPEQLARPCVYNYPEPSVRDVAWIGRHTVHEAAHHLADVTAITG
ncbi:MAG: hypothetical protein QOG64_257 [Acidimicrobiaceae bacterium]|nr:hypothetical protein [Acidimicrobiaceae bacterium]